MFFDRSRRWQQDDFPICSAFSPELLCKRVPTFSADIVFLALNFLLQTIPCFAAKIANNHGFSPESRFNGLFFSVNSRSGPHAHPTNLRDARQLSRRVSPSVP